MMNIDRDGIRGGSVPRRLYVLMAVAGCIVPCVMAGGFFLGVRLSTVDAPMANAAVRIRLEATIANLMIEEMASTGITMSLSRNWESLERAVSTMANMLSRSGGGVFSSRGVDEKKALLRIQSRLEDLKREAIERLYVKRRSMLPQAVDERYNQVFGDFMSAVSDLERMIEKMQTGNFTRFRQTQIAMILLSLALLGAVCLMFIRFERHRSDIIRSLLAARGATEKEMAARQTAQQALKERSLALEESNKALEQFASVASHDLQEPLRMVSSYVRLLERRYKGRLDPDADAFIGFALAGADRMQDMIEALLVYSRIDARSRPFTAVRSDAALDKAMANLKMAIAESRACIRRDPLPLVWGDETQLITLFQNLISNAIKFRESGTPEVHISWVETRGVPVFSIRDNGIGFDPKFSERIFNIFDRLHTVSEYAGTGMGLAICQKIVERHGGRIWAEGRPGRGATFSFSLPAPPPEKISEATAFGGQEPPVVSAAEGTG